MCKDIVYDIIELGKCNNSHFSEKISIMHKIQEAITLYTAPIALNKFFNRKPATTRSYHI